MTKIEVTASYVKGCFVFNAIGISYWKKKFNENCKTFSDFKFKHPTQTILNELPKRVLGKS
jgi:hypothetical protein